MGSRITLALTASVVCAAGCSLLVDMHGLANGEVEGDVAPGEVLDEDGGLIIIGSEGGLVDRQAPRVDSGSSGGGSTFCTTLSPAPTFCRDFDDGTPFETGFVLLRKSGTLAADSVDSRSQPNALAASVSTANAYAYMRRSFPSATSKVRLAFDLRMDKVQASGNGALVAQVDVGGATKHSLRLMVASGHTTLEEWHGNDFGQYTFKSNARPTQGSWGKIDLTLTVGSAPRLLITYGGTTTVDQALPGGEWSGASPEVSVGLIYLPNAGPWALRQDNVVVDVQ